MPEPLNPESPTATAGEQGGSLTRRTMLTGAAVAGTGLLSSRAVATPGGHQPDRGHLTPAQSSISVQPSRLALEIDNTAKLRVPGKAVPLRIATSSPEVTELQVSTATGNATVGLRKDDAGLARSVGVSVAAGAPVTVWVVPHWFGSPGLPGDQITVKGKRDSVLIDVWIEPIGGDWDRKGPNKQSLDMEIVAVHAALMRAHGGGAEVVMYSPPRLRKKGGEFDVNEVKNPDEKEKWKWDVHDMGAPECRTLDLATWTTRELNPYREKKEERYIKNNIFCSGAAHLPDGRLLVAGGHVHAASTQTKNGSLLHVYDPQQEVAKRWTKLDFAMKETRWYPTVTPLPDGRVLITGGGEEGLWFDDDEYFTKIHNNYVIYDGKSLTERKDLVKLPNKTPRLAAYPGMFVLPDAGNGTVIAIVDTYRAWLHTYATRQDSKQPELLQVGGPWNMTQRGSRSYPWYGSMVLLPLRPDVNTRTILAVGGAAEGSTNYNEVVGKKLKTPHVVAKNKLVAKAAEVQGTARTAQLLKLDMTQSPDKAGSWKKIDTKAEKGRFLCDATLLADGTVLVSGGANRGWANNNSGPVHEAEIFNPVTETFRLVARAHTQRRYHSVALLLPDGTVLKAGSNGGFGGPDEKDTKSWFLSRTDAERYLPPYLWRGPRPSISGVGTSGLGNITLGHGRKFTISATGESLDKESQVALIRLGATTHGNNMEQRYVWLKVSNRNQAGDTWTIEAATPTNKAAAPPGDYMLVVVDSQGVPSKAELVRVSS